MTTFDGTYTDPATDCPSVQCPAAPWCGCRGTRPLVALPQPPAPPVVADPWAGVEERLAARAAGAYIRDLIAERYSA